MDPFSVGLFVVMAVVIVVLVIEARSLRQKVEALNHLSAEIAAKAAAPEPRVLALEIENRTIKAEIDEIRAAGKRAELDRAVRHSRPGSFRAFKNELKGAEIEPK